MPNKIIPPTITSKSFSCPRCGAHADQHWLALHAAELGQGKELPTILNEIYSARLAAESLKPVDYLRRVLTGDIVLEGAFVPNKPVTQAINLHLSVCYSCKQCTLWKHTKIVFPQHRYEIEPNDDLLDDIKTDFEEARTILDISPRGACALLRLCIQKLLKQLGQRGKDINEDIAILVKKGLDPRIQKMLDIVRITGNEAVHPGVIDLRDDRETATKLFVLVNRITYDMLTHPREVDALYGELPAEKIAGVIERDNPDKIAGKI